MDGSKECHRNQGPLAKIVAQNTLSLQLQVSVTVCAHSVSLITRGYSNVTNELCMRAQLPLYSPRD